MRSSLISLVIFVSLSLVTSYSVPVATAAGSKSSKSAVHRGAKSHSRKGKKLSANSGNVWERIRLGLRIPRPSPSSAGFDHISIPLKPTVLAIQTSEPVKEAAAVPMNGRTSRLTTVISPQKQLLKKSPLIEKYTGLGKKLFATNGQHTILTKKSSGSLYNHPTQQPLVKSNELFRSPSIQRVRTKLGLHPELFKQDITTPEATVHRDTLLAKSNKNLTQPQLTIKYCSDLNKKDVITLAGQGLLSDSYPQLAQQCRSKQDAIYERVSRHIAGYSQKSGFLWQASERARPFLYHIVDALSKHGLPLDLALLPIVESAYQATALSPMNAAGIWQFIPSTGRDFDLEQNDEYDARLDVTAATHAAIRFLGGLNSHFKGDWLLALAAYNCGQGAVDAAIAKNQAEGLDTDFWSLDLPAETQDYVPRLLAIASIFANPGSYGLKPRPVRNEPYFIKVNVDRDIDIAQLVEKDLNTIAKLADFNAEEFGVLNAAYLKTNLTKRKPYSFLLPISHANQLHQSLAFLAQPASSMPTTQSSQELPLFFFPQPDISTPLLALSIDEHLHSQLPNGYNAKTQISPKSDDKQTTKNATAQNYLAVHYLDKGESLKALAAYHGISEAALREVNKFKKRQSLSLGQRLLIPLKQLADSSIKSTHSSILYKGTAGLLSSLEKISSK